MSRTWRLLPDVSYEALPLLWEDISWQVRLRVLCALCSGLMQRWLGLSLNYWHPMICNSVLTAGQKIKACIYINRAWSNRDWGFPQEILIFLVTLDWKSILLRLEGSRWVLVEVCKSWRKATPFAQLREEYKCLIPNGSWCASPFSSRRP